MNKLLSSASLLRLFFERVVSALDKHRVFMLATLVSGLFYLFNREFFGPAYLSDEIGYLAKSIALAGYETDISSSWHAGYSILIYPIFRLTSDPYTAWQMILLFNSLLWGVVVMLLSRIIYHTHPHVSSDKRFLAVVGALIYPSWLLIAGYAFTTTLFIAVFLASVLSFINKRFLSSAFFAAFLFWIHPVGIVVCIAYIILYAIIITDGRDRKNSIIAVATIIFLASLYALYVHVEIGSLLNTDPAKPRTFSAVSKIYSEISSSARWLGISMTQLGSIAVSTFGLIGVFYINSISMFWSNRKSLVKKIVDRPYYQVSVLSLLSITFAVLMGSIGFAVFNRQSLDHFLYTRYTEMVMILGLTFGILKLRKKHLMIVAIFVLSIALILLLGSSLSDIKRLNLVNVLSFWPLPLIDHKNIVHYFFIGGFWLLLLSRIIDKRTLKLATLLCFGLAVATIHLQFKWHNKVLQSYSNPEPLYTTVKSYTNLQCLSVDPEIPDDNFKKERIRLYSYYFYDLNVRKMSRLEWQESDCRAYMTYSPHDFMDTSSTEVIATEGVSGLSIIKKLD